MDIGINLKNKGPYIVTVQKDEGLPILYLSQFRFDKKSNVRLGPEDAVLHFDNEELLHVIKYLTTERTDIKNINIIVEDNYV